MARDWLKTLRLQKKLSQMGLATAAGLNPGSKYSRIELGYVDPDPAEVRALAKVLGTTTEFVLTGKNPVEAKGMAIAAKKVAEAPPSPPAAPPPVASVSVPPPSSSPTPAAEKPSSSAPAATDNLPAQPTAVYDGKDITDPVNFALLPPLHLLERGPMDEVSYRAHLHSLITKSTKVLHTSKIRPKIWTAWRDFERKAQELLRGAPRQTPAFGMAPTAFAAPAVPAARPAPQSFAPPPAAAPRSAPAPMPSPSSSAPAPRSARAGNKNYAGIFFDCAQQLLPTDKFEELRAAGVAAKAADPSSGFMKHFVRLSKERLPSSELAQIETEVKRQGG